MGLINSRKLNNTMGKVTQKTGNKAAKGSKKVMNKFVLNCSLPVNDNVIVLNDFTDFLTQKIKVEGKTGQLGNVVTVSKDKNNVVEAKIDFSKRYLKYLTKKYMKKQQLRDYLRVVATSKNTYELRYLQLD